MSGSLDDFLGAKPEEETTREPEAPPAPEQQAVVDQPEAQQPEAKAPEQQAENKDVVDQPEPQQPGHQVPRAALEAERRKRQEREAEAADLRRQLDEFKRGQQQPQQAQPQPEMTDEQRFIARIQDNARQAAVEASINRELNRSERAARAKYGDEQVDAALAEYQRVYQMAPQVQQVVLDQPDPFAFIVEQSAHVREVGEFSRNGDAYRQRIEAELRAKWEAEQAGQQRQAPPLPRQQPSLAGTRSSAPRGAVPYSGPTPLEDILPGTARR